MARSSIMNFIALAGISALADASYASQPTCATSDGTQSTACGSGALASNTGVSNSAIGAYSLYYNLNGLGNAAGGRAALEYNTTGNLNAAFGAASLLRNTSGSYNTALGVYALWSNTTTSNLTAVGYEALFSSNTAVAAGNLTAVGFQALYSNTTGTGNSAHGYQALYGNTTGADNTADGVSALHSNTTGNYNAASGYYALKANTTGIFNAAFGAGALLISTTASENTALGTGSLYHDTTGYGNSATGFTALFNNASGIRNTAVGTAAGASLVTGNYNTYIGYGVAGGSGENYVTRIGVSATDANFSGTPTTFISGIWGTTVTGSPAQVVVNANGQLGVINSSERYKRDIAPLARDSEKLSLLRPVSFHLKADPDGAIQYGLIAEEVDRVYPELVIRDNQGRIQGVRYDELAPMLLNEVQKQQQVNRAQAARIASLEQQVTKVNDLEHELAEMRTALAALKLNDQLVAQR